MCRLPVTLGGGMTMLNGSAFGLSVGANAPDSSQAAYRRGSTVFGSKVFSSMAVSIDCVKRTGKRQTR